MTSPLPPGDDPPDEDDELAELLLADAVASGDQPARGEQTTTPDMGDNAMTAPTAPQPTPAAAPAPQPAPAPAPAPATPPAPAPAPATPPPANPSPTTPGGQQPPQPGAAYDPEFPAGVAVADMNPEQQAAYWRAYARRNEARLREMADYDELKRIRDEHQRMVEANQTEHERALAEARRQGGAEARLAVGNTTVEAMVRAAAHNWNNDERVNALLRGLNRSQFINPNTGEVDVQGVYDYVGALAPVAPVYPAAVVQPAPGQPGQPAPVGQPAPGGQPGQPAAPAYGQPMQAAPTVAPVPTPAPPRVTDFGQGAPAVARPSGLAAGAEIARARYGNKPGTGPSTPQQ